MHRLSSHSLIRRYRIASLMVVMMFLSAPTGIGFVIYAFTTGNHEWFVFGGISGVAWLVFMTIGFVMGGRLRCPLCMVQPLLNRRCSKHRTAATFLGSYRLRVALSILFRNSFRCPYCGESTAMQVRQRVKH